MALFCQKGIQKTRFYYLLWERFSISQSPIFDGVVRNLNMAHSNEKRYRSSNYRKKAAYEKVSVCFRQVFRWKKTQSPPFLCCSRIVWDFSLNSNNKSCAQQYIYVNGSFALSCVSCIKLSSASTNIQSHSHEILIWVFLFLVLFRHK